MSATNEQHHHVLKDRSPGHDAMMARALVLDALAQALADPAMLAGPAEHSELATVLREAAEKLGSAACRRALFALADLPAHDEDALRERFQRCIHPPDARPLPLYESLALSGHLVSPITEEVAHAYRRHGLEPDADLPDAASVELAFLAYLVEAEAEALLVGETGRARRLRQEQRRFCQE
ncbi:MAG: hypothetical protein D6791_10760, partial [Chloroflexi bacterium]